MRLLGQLVVNGLVAAGIYALVAVGFSLTYRVVKFFNFAHGAAIACGAYVAYAAMHMAGWGLAASLLLGGLGASAVGIAIDFVVYRPLRSRRSPPLAFLLASFGTLIVFQNALALAFGSRPLLLRSQPAAAGISLGFGTITISQLAILGVAVMATLAVRVFLLKSRVGWAVRAASDDETGARAVGIDPEAMIRLSFGLGSFLAGIGGALIALETRLEPTMGMPLMLKGIVASVVGGVGNTMGAILGALLVGLAENVGVISISSGWKDAIAFGILILFLLLRPQGILGTSREQL